MNSAFKFKDAEAGAQERAGVVEWLVFHAFALLVVIVGSPKTKVQGPKSGMHLQQATVRGTDRAHNPKQRGATPRTATNLRTV